MNNLIPRLRQARLNCWEYMRCGREPGGVHVRELGVCPAAIESRVNGVNGGWNGGRCCWAIANTPCDRRAQGDRAQKMAQCARCPFYRYVETEPDECAMPTLLVLRKLQS